MDYDFDIYIAGPMTGRPLFNHPAFNAAEAKYAALGYRVFNPAKNGLPPESPWREHMRVDIAALLRSRSVMLLDGWMDSRGANIEHDIAAAVGAPLFLDRIVAEDDLRFFLGEPLAPQQAAPKAPRQAAPTPIGYMRWKNGGAEYLADKNWGTPDDGSWYVVSIAHHALQQAAPTIPQKPELRVGQIWRTRGGDVVEVLSETENSPRPFVCGFPGQARCKLTVTKNGTCYESAQHPADLIELITDVKKGGEA